MLKNDLTNNELYLERTDLVPHIMKYDAFTKANLRNGSFWQMMDNPMDRRVPMIKFDTMRPAMKEKINAHYGGNVYAHHAKLPVKALVKEDPSAEKFYMEYTYDAGKHLPGEHIKKYTSAAAWLNMILELNENKRRIKTELKLSLDEWWDIICEIIKIDGLELPTSMRRLMAKMKEYKEEGYTCLIDWRFGNKNGAKLGKTEAGFCPETHRKQIAVIRRASSHANNFDAVQITRGANKLFEENGWPTLSSSTIYNIINEQKVLTLSGSRGVRTYSNKLERHVKRKRTTYPLAYATLDGWTAELLYQDGNSYNNRLVVVIVLDPMNNYPIGYAIGDRESGELIRQANRNALLHINSIFGAPYRPWQLQSDNFAIKANRNFFDAMAHLFTPAAVGNAKAKVIEPYFDYLNHKYCQFESNWSGHNVTSRLENQPNAEYLNKIKSFFPEKAGVIAQIETIIAKERALKIEEYMKAWESCDENDKAGITYEQCLMVFGREHSKDNSITGEGLRITINGERLVYDSYDPAFRELQHLKFRVVYDESDLSHVLAVQPESRKRFLLSATRAIPMDIRSMTADDHAELKRVRDFNKMGRDKVIKTFIEDAEIVDQLFSDTPLALNDENEASLKLMFTQRGQQKEKLADAKGLKKVQAKAQKQLQQISDAEYDTFEKLRVQSLNDKIQFNQFLD